MVNMTFYCFMLLTNSYFAMTLVDFFKFQLVLLNNFCSINYSLVIYLLCCDLVILYFCMLMLVVFCITFAFTTCTNIGQLGFDNLTSVRTCFRCLRTAIIIIIFLLGYFFKILFCNNMP